MAKRAVATRESKKLTRAEKSQKIKDDLFHAAAKVVGELGYSNAMVSKITAEAKVAQGTFYSHFESQQDLFDQLLPALGVELLGFIRARVGGAHTALERERRSFLAFFEFLKLKPEFYRILYEAEMFAPQAFRIHMERIGEAYVRTLEWEAARGQMKVSGRDETQALAYTLMGARHYLCMHFARRNGTIIDLPDWVVGVYMGLVAEGVYADAGSNSKAGKRTG